MFGDRRKGWSCLVGARGIFKLDPGGPDPRVLPALREEPLPPGAVTRVATPGLRHPGAAGAIRAAGRRGASRRM